MELVATASVSVKHQSFAECVSISPERGDSGHVPGVGISTGLGSLSLSPSFCAPREGWLQGSSPELAHSGSKVILTL